MLKRTLIVLSLILLLTLAVQGCNPPIAYYTSMQVMNVDGKPFRLLPADA